MPTDLHAVTKTLVKAIDNFLGSQPYGIEDVDPALFKALQAARKATKGKP